jgi:hypothetical protein
MPDGAVLVISDGDVGGLLAAAAATDPAEGQVYLWTPESDEFGVFQRRAAEAAAELLGATAVPPGLVGGLGGDPGVSQMLLRAGGLARSLSCTRVIWPVVWDEGDVLDTAVANADRAFLVSQLLSLDGPAVEIECPYADYSGQHLADLVLDMDLPIWTCWWFDPDALPAALRGIAAAERERWTGLLHGAGWRGPLPRPRTTATE